MTDPFQWVHVSSLKKTPYQVGIKKGEHLTSPRKGDDLKIELAAKPTEHAKSVHVDWEVGDKTWKSVSQDVRDLGISRYRLYEARPVAASRPRPKETPETPAGVATTYYMLEFTSFKGNTFSFHTRDDFFDFFAFSDGDHAIWYRAAPGSAAIIGVI
ncbi:hypothetical protein BD410DRAFT_803364 [Rickenella mellea]|uniref:Uncharacterized protein n=1 Tax=Rickenella mellea TaxID=50990 RepID=A0A4Y7Q4J3_9AGAM|nr:hypothetical protein BD410DRAFT_803364 [Rickenella mellea]